MTSVAFCDSNAATMATRKKTATGSKSSRLSTRADLARMLTNRLVYKGAALMSEGRDRETEAYLTELRDKLGGARGYFLQRVLRNLHVIREREAATG